MFAFSTIEEALADLRQGKIIVCTDDPDRENEGDFICAGEFASPENVNFMACHGKGLLCMPISEAMAKKLDLAPMVQNNTDNHATAFTVSIDHSNTTTGISAFERSMTTIQAAREGARPADFRRPGHMFPLIAKEGGVIERQGHTEATVNLMQLAGLKEVGLCCEIMRSDGTMMRTPELKELATAHGLKFITIQDLQAYYKRHHKIVEKVVEATLPTKYGKFKIIGYENKQSGEHHVALVMGNISGTAPVLVRVHSECLTGDALGSSKCDCGDQYDAAMRQISHAGRGVLVYLRQEGRGIGLINKLKAYALQDSGLDTVQANVALGFAPDPRDYAVGCQILQDLGVKKMQLLTNNPQKIQDITQYGLEIVQRLPIETKLKPENAYYMETKKEKMGHILTSCYK